MNLPSDILSETSKHKSTWEDNMFACVRQEQVISSQQDSNHTERPKTKNPRVAHSALDSIDWNKALFDVMRTLLIEGLNAIGIVQCSWEVLGSHF